jgi:hypothetical protein
MSPLSFVAVLESFWDAKSNLSEDDVVIHTVKVAIRNYGTVEMQRLSCMSLEAKGWKGQDKEILYFFS